MQIPIRFKMVGLLWLMMTIGFMDRVNISVAAPVIMKQMGWGEGLFGIIFSSFLVGYAAFQIPGGLTADKWGGRAVLAIAVLGWSVFTALTPPAMVSLYVFLGMRFFVGAFESVTAPTIASMNAKWFPQKEFATAQMVALAGNICGQLIAFPLTTWIIIYYNWPMVFYSYSVLGILWVAIWLYYSTNSPREHASVTPAELEYIQRGKFEQEVGEAGERQKAPFSILLRSPGIIALTLGYLFWAYGGWMMVAWLPTYLVKARDFSLQEMGWVGMFPMVAGFAGIVMGGVISDHLLRSGRSMRMSRQGFPAFSIALASILIIIAVSVNSPFYAVVFLVAFQFVNLLGTPGFWSTASALYPSSVGAVTGIMHFGACIGAIFGPLVAGFLVAKTGNWALPFYTAAAASLVAAYLLFFGVKTKSPQSRRVVAVAECELAPNKLD